METEKLMAIHKCRVCKGIVTQKMLPGGENPITLKILQTQGVAGSRCLLHKCPVCTECGRVLINGSLVDNACPYCKTPADAPAIKPTNKEVFGLAEFYQIVKIGD